MSGPRFTVFVSAWNFEKWIEQCLWSIATQDYADFQCLVGLDAPEDQTPRIVREFARQDPRFQVIEHPARLYPLGNMLAMLPNATGEIGLRVDGDDYLLSSRALSRIAEEYDRDPECDMTHGSFAMMPQFAVAQPIRWTREVGFSKWCFLHPISWRVAVARKCVSENRTVGPAYRDEYGMEYRVAGDVAWTYPLAAHARKVVSIYDPLYAYRLHPGNEHNTHRAEQLAVEARVGPYWDRFLARTIHDEAPPGDDPEKGYGPIMMGRDGGSA